MILEIEVTNWAKYNARNDVKSCTWFRMSNDFFNDPDLYGASVNSRIVWIYILCIASKKNSSTVRINTQMLLDAIKIDETDLFFALNELGDTGCLRNLSDAVISTRSNPVVTKMLPSATDRQTDRQTVSGKPDFTPGKWLDVKKILPEVESQEIPKNNPALFEVEAPSLDEETRVEQKASNAITLLNALTGKNFRPVPSHLKHINARLNEGYSLEDFKTVIAFKQSKWGNDPKWSAYLRPETIFGTKFDSYLQEAQSAFKPKLDPLDVFLESQGIVPTFVKGESA
jgi:uncharacterized phage protein (TIGR02220 family)